MRFIFWKTITREIRGSMGRFLAIVGIVALGAGCLTGLQSSEDAMLHTAQRYIDSRNLFDFRLLSSLGFEQAQVDAVAGIVGVRDAEGTLSLDALCSSGQEADYVLRILSLNRKINLPDLKEGRMPQNGQECLGDALIFSSSSIGQTVRISADNSQDVKDRLLWGEYTIVGLATSPQYLNFERGTTSLGNGSVAGFLYIPFEGLDAGVFTDICVTLQSGGPIYSADYENAVDGMMDAVTAACRRQAELRFDMLVSNSRTEIEDGEKEYADGLATYLSEKADADKDLADGLQKLLDAKAELAASRAETEAGRAELRARTASGRQALYDAEQELTDAKAELDDGEARYNEGLAELRDGEKAFDDGLAAFADGYGRYVDAKKQYEDGLDAYNEGLAQYEDGLAKYNQGREGFISGIQALAEAAEQLNDSEAQYTQLSGLYGAVSSVAAERGMAAGEFIDSLETTLALASGGDPAAAATLAYLDGILSGAAGMTAEALVLTWRQAEAQLDAAGFGNELDQAALDAMRAAIDEGWSQYQAGLDAVKDGGDELAEAKVELEDSKAELDDAEQELKDSRRQLDDGWAALSDSRRQLDDGWADYESGLNKVAEGWNTLEAETAEAGQELLDAEQKLADGQAEYADGVGEYYESKAEAETKLTEAEQKLADNRKKLDDAAADLDALEPPDTWVFTRGDSVGYTSFQGDADAMGGIARVFPVFFFLVAALVCVTTMSRMVDEQRYQIGTFKALGFGKLAVMRNYLFYAGAAALLGCLLGILPGSYLFPAAIWKAFGIMYRFADNVLFTFKAGLSLRVSLAFILGTMAVTWFTCSRALSEVPAELIRPRAPKAGKRTVWERVPLLWNRLGFLGKVCVRNVFRYRQRLFMTVVGIGGCMALLLTGFGIEDSIRGVADREFEEIALYDGTVVFSEEMTPQDRADFAETNADVIDEITFLHMSSADLTANGTTKNAILIVPGEEGLDGFFDLHQGARETALPGPGEAVLSDHLAERLRLSVGDSFSVRDSGGESLRVTVSGIFDNFVQNYCFVGRETLITQWGHGTPFKAALVNFRKGTDDHAAAARLTGSSRVSNVALTADLRTRVDKSLHSLISVVLLIVCSAGMLAFIVLYNLTNINIRERIREIATIKVLGFYPWETASYVFRENFILTGLGALVGIPLGVLLHRFVMSRIDVNMIRFDVHIAALSFLWAVALTFAFTGIVNLFMFRHIRNVNMAESLKSVE